MSTAAQEEFNILASKNTVRETIHPEDRNDPDLQDRQEDLNEEDTFRNQQIDSAMRVSTGAAGLKLPPASFDSGRSTGVKGVIADARSYETARQSKWRTRVQAARRSIFGTEQLTASVYLGGRSDSETDEDAISNKGSRKNSNNEEESFLSQWRDNRRKELESEASRPEIRQRRTSPSVRVYGRLDTVDALGYLDAVEKVGRATTVVVFVTDSECDVSASIESAMLPLVRDHTAIHFVKVHYDEIEFDPAAAPSILAYRNQGDLFANLTGIIEMIPDEDDFGTEPLRHLFRQHGIL